MRKPFKTVTCRVPEAEYAKLLRVLAYRNMTMYEYLRCCLAVADCTEFFPPSREEARLAAAPVKYGAPTKKRLRYRFFAQYDAFGNPIDSTHVGAYGR